MRSTPSKATFCDWQTSFMGESDPILLVDRASLRVGGGIQRFCRMAARGDGQAVGHLRAFLLLGVTVVNWARLALTTLSHDSYVFGTTGSEEL